MRTVLEKRFFCDYGDESVESYFVSRFIISAFELCRSTNDDRATNAEEDSEGLSDEDAVTNVRQRFCLRHKAPGLEMRRTFVEFGRCFCSGSIAAGVLRNQNAVRHAADIGKCMRKFAYCAHVHTNSANIGLHICELCARELDKVSARGDAMVASISRLAHALVDSAMCDYHITVRSITASASDVITRAIAVRAHYSSVFYAES